MDTSSIGPTAQLINFIIIFAALVIFGPHILRCTAWGFRPEIYRLAQAKCRKSHLLHAAAISALLAFAPHCVRNQHAESICGMVLLAAVSILPVTLFRPFPVAVNRVVDILFAKGERRRFVGAKDDRARKDGFSLLPRREDEPASLQTFRLRTEFYPWRVPTGSELTNRSRPLRSKCELASHSRDRKTRTLRS